jgi:hypothetical protein
MNTPSPNEIHTVCWQGDSEGYLEILDQTALPAEIKYVACKNVPAVIEAIKMLRVPRRTCNWYCRCVRHGAGHTPCKDS